MMTFGVALDFLKQGSRLTREGWNGKGMYVELQVPDKGSKMKRPYLFMRPIDGDLVPWVASQSDLLAVDWVLFGANPSSYCEPVKQTESERGPSLRGERLAWLLERVSFRGWTWRVGKMDDGHFVQAQFMAPCADGPSPPTPSPRSESGRGETVQRGRKWYLSPHATDDEVIKTLWLAVEVALRHEAMEEFLVDGVRVFGPHTPFEALVELQGNVKPDARKDNSS